jgi:arsenate reductase
LHDLLQPGGVRPHHTALIRNAGIERTVIECLRTPLDRATLAALITHMGISPRQLLREKGTSYAEPCLGASRWTDTQLVDKIFAHPILVNSPIDVTPWGVKLCRPSEAVLDILPPPQNGPFRKENGELGINAAGALAYALAQVSFAMLGRAE